MKRTALLATIAVIAVALAATAWAQHGRQGKGAPPHRGVAVGEWWNNPQVQDELNLTDEQIDALEDAHASFEKTAKSLRFDIQQARLDLERAFSEERVDAKRVNELAKKLASLQGKLTEARISLRLKVSQILTYEQRQKVQKLIQHRARLHRRFGPRPMPEPPEQPE